MTTSVGVHEAKTHLSRLLEKVAAGEEVLITNRGTVVARLVAPEKPRITYGWDRTTWIADDFDAPLPDELLDMFES